MLNNIFFLKAKVRSVVMVAESCVYIYNVPLDPPVPTTPQIWVQGAKSRVDKSL